MKHLEILRMSYGVIYSGSYRLLTNERLLVTRLVFELPLDQLRIKKLSLDDVNKAYQVNPL